MFLGRTILISLDVNDTTIVSVIANQYDSNSRFIEATCTDNGVKMPIDNEVLKAVVVCNKPDDTVVVNNATILSNGNVLIELTKQMLAVSGRCTCNLMLLDASGEIDVNSETDIEILKTFALSTMPFYLNVIEFATSTETIESSSEFNTFIDYINKSIAVEKDLKISEKARVDAEKARVYAELDRDIAESDRDDAEKLREKAEKGRVETFKKNEADRKSTFEASEESRKTAFEENEKKYQSAFESSEASRETTFNNNEKERQRVFGIETDTAENGTMYGVMNSTKQLIEEGNAVIEETQELLGTKDDDSEVDTLYGIQKALQKSIKDSDAAEQRATEAAQKCEDVVAGTGIVFATDIANNLTTTETGKVLDATQGTELLSMITSLQQTIANMPKVHTGTTDPANTLGNNGDYYLKLLTEE